MTEHQVATTLIWIFHIYYVNIEILQPFREELLSFKRSSHYAGPSSAITLVSIQIILPVNTEMDRPMQFETSLADVI